MLIILKNIVLLYVTVTLQNKYSELVHKVVKKDYTGFLGTVKLASFTTDAQTVLHTSVNIHINTAALKDKTQALSEFSTR